VAGDFNKLLAVIRNFGGFVMVALTDEDAKSDMR